jgi:hypothetical protein
MFENIVFECFLKVYVIPLRIEYKTALFKALIEMNRYLQIFPILIKTLKKPYF